MEAYYWNNIYNFNIICNFWWIKIYCKSNSNLVPVMVILYFIIGVYILISNIDSVPSTFYLIFSEAFNFNTIVQGGFGD